MRGMVCAAAVIAAMTALPAAASTGPPKLLSSATGTVFKIRPPKVGFTGDGTAFVAGHGKSARHPGHIKWKWWTDKSAKGVGRVWVNDCTPSCAKGQFHPDRGWIKANQPQDGHFTHLVVHFRENGHGQTDYRQLRYVPGDPYDPAYWEWAYASR